MLNGSCSHRKHFNFTALAVRMAGRAKSFRSVAAELTVCFLCSTLFVTHCWGAEPPKTRREVIDVPGLSPFLRCEAKRQGLVCRVVVDEPVAFGEVLELEIKSLEPGEWKTAALTVGSFLKATPEVQNSKAPGPADGTNRLSFEWNFQLDTDIAERLLAARLAPLQKKIVAMADKQGLTGERRDRFLEVQPGAMALETAVSLLESEQILILDELREFQNSRAADVMLQSRTQKPTSDQQVRLKAAFVAEDQKQLGAVLQELPDIKSRINSEVNKNRKLTDKQKAELRASLVASIAFDALQEMRLLRESFGLKAPGMLRTVRGGVERLRMICEWQAAELLFLRMSFPLDDVGLVNWQAAARELQDWLHNSRPTDMPYEFLTPEYREILQKKARVTYRVEFVPLLPGESGDGQDQPNRKPDPKSTPKPDIGWTAAYRMALKPNAVGSILWTGTTAKSPGFQSAWLQVDAPAGLKCVLLSGSQDVTCCIAEGDKRTFLRIAPRNPGSSVSFEAVVTHDTIKGQRVRWEQPKSSNAVAFPF